MSGKDCGNHGERRRIIVRGIFAFLLILLFLILLAILLVWVILRPRKPVFTLQDATIYSFNLSSAPPALLSSSIQVTLSSRNPNSRIGIYYDRLDLYASYRSQQLTLRTRIGPTYQGHKDIDLWAPFLYGAAVPLAPSIGAALGQDQSAGMILLLIKIDGRLRWRVGSVITKGYHVHVTCPAYITLGGNHGSAAVVGGGVKYQLVQRCSVSV